MNKSAAGIIGFLLIIAFASAQSSLEVPAVDAEGKGTLSEISVAASPGEGDIFMSIKPLTGIDTQHSEKIAVELAAKHANVDIKKFNLLFKIESTAEVVDGPSAGAALALLSYTELSGRRMRPDLTITGTIDRDGHVGKVGGIFEKAKAVSESVVKKYKVFLVPRGQAIQSGVDLPKYAKEKWGLQVAEVDTIEDILNFAFNSSEGSEVPVTLKIIPPIVLIPFKTSGQSDLFKGIAASEVEAAAGRLKSAKITDSIKAALEESVNLSRTQLSKGYFYSAANTAFLTTLSLDEFSLSNGSKKELQEKLKELKEKLADFNFTAQTENNFEWVVGAKLRHQWASTKLADADYKIASGNYVSAAGDLAVATSWLRASGRMEQIAQNKVDGREMKDIYYRDFASKLIEDAKALDAKGLLDDEALDHLDTAIKAFESANYLAAAFDSAFATSYADAYEEIADADYKEVILGLCKSGAIEVTCDIFKEKKRESLWAELYYAHALYNLQESNRSRDSQSLVNGIKLLKLSDGFESVRKQSLEILANPPTQTGTGNNDLPAASPAPSIGRQLRVEVTSVPEDSSRNLIFYSIVLLVALLGIYAYLVRRRPGEETVAGAGQGTKIERAEELLLKGKISERSFEYFKKKYGKKAFNAARGKARKKK